MNFENAGVESQLKRLRKTNLDWFDLSMLACSVYAQVRIASAEKIVSRFRLIDHSEKKRFVRLWTRMNTRRNCGPLDEIARSALRSRESAEAFIRMCGFLRNSDLGFVTQCMLLRCAIADDERAVRVCQALGIENVARQNGMLVPTFAEFWALFDTRERMVLIKSLYSALTRAMDVYQCVNLVYENFEKLRVSKACGMLGPAHNFWFLHTVLDEICAREG